MPSILTETTLTIAQAATRLPGSTTANSSQRFKLLRWITRGVKLNNGSKLKLEAVMVGRVWHTSAEALERFFARTTADAQGAAAPVIRRTPAARNRAYEAAVKELEAMGC